jgi:hypothetical protein
MNHGVRSHEPVGTHGVVVEPGGHRDRPHVDGGQGEDLACFLAHDGPGLDAMTTTGQTSLSARPSTSAAPCTTQARVELFSGFPSGSTTSTSSAAPPPRRRF